MRKKAIIVLLILMTAAAGWSQTIESFGYRAETTFFPNIRLKDIPAKTEGTTLVDIYILGKKRNIERGFSLAMINGMEKVSKDQYNITGLDFGVLSGIEVLEILKLIKLTGLLRAGGGYLKVYDENDRSYNHFIIASLEASGELSIQIAANIYISGLIEYQVISNLVPGNPFRDFSSYSPVCGIRVGIGKR